MESRLRRVVGFLVFVALIVTNRCGCVQASFNKTLVLLNSEGKVSSVTNITVGPSAITNRKTSESHNASLMALSMSLTNATKDDDRPKRQKPVSACGIPAIPTKMNSVAEFKEWPWHVAIVEAKDDLYICGGSLVSATQILTGAHCLMPYVPGRGTSGKGLERPRLKIRAGEWDVSTNSEPLPHVEVLVHKMTLHPDFDSRTLENDIAVIHLARPILPAFRSNILPVCLPKESRKNGTRGEVSSLKRCVVTGWGRSSEATGHSIVLKEIVLPIWENDRCERQLSKHFGRTFILPSTAICAGDEANDACDGDGGGPLVCFHDGSWVQEGIVSFGIGCGRPDSPGVYTRVASYLQFLKSELEMS